MKAYFMVYVDDVLLVGPRDWVRATITAIQGQWECKVNGILSNPEWKFPTDVDVVDSPHFLGVVLEYQDGCLVVHQTKYIVAKLQKRGLLTGTSKASLPQIQQGRVAPEDRNSVEYERMLDKSRVEVGALQWLAQKTRPDIAAVTSMAASLQSRCPTEALRLTVGILEVPCRNMECGNEGGGDLGVSCVSEAFE